MLKKDGRKIDFSLEAEGFRKLGLLWKLIRNGLLEEGSILLWDEPEANLNPELYPLVASILLELQRNFLQMKMGSMDWIAPKLYGQLIKCIRYIMMRKFGFPMQILLLKVWNP